MNGLSLCSGIGGFDLGIKLAVPSYQTICYVEIEPFCQDILLARMADGVVDRAPIWGDLRRFDARPWRGLVDVIHGGYPCQPFSVAGKRRGVDDPRHLWPDIVQVIRECEPAWCFFENVAGHLRLGFDVVARDLVDLGYRVAAGLFTAAEVGASHRRQRLFVLAHGSSTRSERWAGQGLNDASAQAERPHEDRAGEGDADDAGLEGRRVALGSSADEWLAWPPGPEERDRWERILAVRPELAPAVADANNNRRAGPPVHLPVWRQDAGVPDADGTSSGLATTEAATESAVRRVADGLPRRVDRLKALGNAVVPAVAALAWQTLHGQLT